MDITSVLKDPEFYDLSEPEQAKVISHLDPEFKALAPEEQPKALNGLKGMYGIPDLALGRLGGALVEGVKDTARDTLAGLRAIAEAGTQPPREALMQSGWTEQDINTTRERFKQNDPVMSGLRGAIESDLLTTDPAYRQSSGLIEDVARAAPQVAGQVAASIAGGPLAGGAMMGLQIAGGQNEALRQQEVPEERRLPAAFANAIMQAPLEQIGIGKALKFWKPQRALIQRFRAMGESFGTEALTEFAQQFPEAATNIWAQNPDMSLLQQTEELVRQLPETAAEGARQGAIGGILGGLLGGAGGVRSNIRVNNEIQAEQQAQEAGDTAKATQEALLGELSNRVERGDLTAEDLDAIKAKRPDIAEQIETLKARIKPRALPGPENLEQYTAGEQPGEIQGQPYEGATELSQPYSPELARRMQGPLALPVPRDVEIAKAQELERLGGLALPAPEQQAMLPPGQGFELQGEPYTEGLPTVHQMPDGTMMEGPEHPGAVIGSEAAIADIDISKDQASDEFQPLRSKLEQYINTFKQEVPSGQEVQGQEGTEVSAPAPTQPGWVRIKDNLRPFVEYREITKGKRKGWYEVTIRGKKIKVPPNAINRMPEVVQEENQPRYRRQTEQAGPLTLESVKEIFPGTAVEQTREGFKVSTARGQQVNILNVDHVAPNEYAIRLAYGMPLKPGETVSGQYDRGEILVTNEGGKPTLRHESVHWMEDLGIINQKDARLLKLQINKLYADGKWETLNPQDIGGVEDRAEYITTRLHGKNPKLVERVLQKIRDWLDRFVNFVGKRTAGGVVRDVESGEIYKGEPQPSEQQGVYYSKEMGPPQYRKTPKDIDALIADLEKAAAQKNPETPNMAEAAAQDMGKKVIDATKQARRPGAISYTLQSPYWIPDERAHNIVQAAGREKEASKHQAFIRVDQDADGVSTAQVIGDLRNKGLSVVDKLKSPDLFNIDKSTASPEYKRFAKHLHFMDRTGMKWEVFRAKLEQQGESQDVLEVIDKQRAAYDRELDMMLEDIKEAEGMINPNDTETLKALKESYNYMGQLRGSYFPRKRKPGDYAVLVEDRSGQRYRYHEAYKTTAMNLAKKLQKQGYTGWNGAPVTVQMVKKLPESVYGDLQMAKTAQAIEKAVDKMEGVDPAVANRLRATLVNNVADIMKARGALSSKLGRSKNLVKGYIEDPMTAYRLNVMATAGGRAKAEFAKKAYAQILGQTVTNPDGTETKYQAIDPIADRALYERMLPYIEEQLRNDDRFDRGIALGKSIISFKLLSAPRSAVVNFTALMTTAPSAIHQYALGGKGSMGSVLNELRRSTGHAFGLAFDNEGGLKTDDERQFWKEVKEGNYDNAQYMREAMGNIAGAYGNVWQKAMSTALWLFGKTEKVNRAGTMLAAYRLARKAGQSHEQATQSAFDASDKAHGVYGKSNMPAWASGKGAKKIGSMFYLYQTFQHNYLQMLHDLGFKKKNRKALAFALASPAVISGAKALAGLNLIFWLLGLGMDRDPEKFVYDYIREEMGDYAEQVARYGVVGALGGDISSSLSVGMEVPKNLLDLSGPFGSLVEDAEKAVRFARTGQPGRALEQFAPAPISRFLGALREMETGAVTSTGKRIWDKDGKPYRPTLAEAFSKGILGVQPAKRAALSARQWEAKREEQNFSSKRKLIYERFRAYLVTPDQSSEDLQKLYDLVVDYNAKVVAMGNPPNIPQITKQSLRNQMRKMMRPTKQERGRLQ